MSISKEDIARVKGQGFLINRGTECFSGRVVSIGGVYTADDLKWISECAQRYGNGKIAFTSRLSAEITGITFENIEPARTFLAEKGLYFGGTGAKVRPIVACKGTTCVYGNIDTQALAKVLHDRFYVELGHVKLPHKFKIGVGGCPNSCMKPTLNDVGVEGHRVYTFDEEKCRGCKKCAVEACCPSKACHVVNGKAFIDPEKCLTCGVCVGKCPFEAVPKEAPAMCKIYVGGTWGKKTRPGTPLQGLYAVEEVPSIVEKVMLWYKENGQPKERLGAAIDRLGMDALEKAIEGDDLLNRRDSIIGE